MFEHSYSLVLENTRRIPCNKSPGNASHCHTAVASTRSEGVIAAKASLLWRAYGRNVGPNRNISSIYMCSKLFVRREASLAVHRP